VHCAQSQGRLSAARGVETGDSCSGKEESSSGSTKSGVRVREQQKREMRLDHCVGGSRWKGVGGRAGEGEAEWMSTSAREILSGKVTSTNFGSRRRVDGIREATPRAREKRESKIAGNRARQGIGKRNIENGLKEMGEMLARERQKVAKHAGPLAVLPRKAE